jgi:hypothetical protein
MAEVSTNSTILKFHTNGGTLQISDGTDNYTINNLEPGQLRVGDGMHQVHTHKDYGVHQHPLIGDEELSPISFVARLATIKAASGKTLLEVLRTAGASGLVKEFTVVLRIPDYRGATTGQTVTYANTHVVPPIEIASEADGVQFAMMSVNMMSRTKEGAIARY